MKLLIITAFTFMQFFTIAQSPLAKTIKTTIVDITQKDFTQITNFNANNASFKGFKLNMSKAEALENLKQQTAFSWEYDEYNTKSKDPLSNAEMRIYVSDFVDGKPVDLLYLIWDEGSANLSGISFYEACSKYLIGNAKNLFTNEATNVSSPCLNFTTGQPVVASSSTGVNTKQYLLNSITLITYSSQYSKIPNKMQYWFKFE